MESEKSGERLAVFAFRRKRCTDTWANDTSKQYTLWIRSKNHGEGWVEAGLGKLVEPKKVHRNTTACMLCMCCFPTLWCLFFTLFPPSFTLCLPLPAHILCPFPFYRTSGLLLRAFCTIPIVYLHGFLSCQCTFPLYPYVCRHEYNISRLARRTLRARTLWYAAICPDRSHVDSANRIESFPSSTYRIQ